MSVVINKHPPERQRHRECEAPTEQRYAEAYRYAGSHGGSPSHVCARHLASRTASQARFVNQFELDPSGSAGWPGDGPHML